MDGRCFGCATKFGFFTKEHGCHKCGHAYCKACLPHKAAIPGHGASSKPQAVCSDCYNMLQRPKTQQDNLENEGRYSPPENFKKRVAALNQKQQQSSQSAGVKGQGTQPSMAAAEARQAAKYKKLAPQDRDIAMRLDKLQEERKKKQKTPLTQTEIEERLCKLQGHSPSEQSQQNVYQPPTNKTSEEEMDDLLEQMTDEVALDARLAGQPQPGPNVSSQAASGPSQTPIGHAGDPLIPSEGELKQLVEDAKKLLGAQGQTQEGSSGTTERGAQGESITDEAKRLAEEANKLMEAARTEVARDEECARRDAEKYSELAGRLAELQNQEPVTGLAASGFAQDSDEEDEEKASQNLIKQLLEESKLDEKVESDGFDVPSKKEAKSGEGKSSDGGDVIVGYESGGVWVKHKTKPPKQTPHSEEAARDPDELPWCCICNEDATLRCLGCDRDLYCRRCFREEHREFGEENHVSEPYKAPAK